MFEFPSPVVVAGCGGGRSLLKPIKRCSHSIQSVVSWLLDIAQFKIRFKFSLHFCHKLNFHSIFKDEANFPVFLSLLDIPGSLVPARGE